MTRLWRDGEPIAVAVDAEGLPQRLQWQGRWHAVAAIANRWRVRSTWWAADAWREYYKLTTTDGLLCTVYHDLQSDGWFWARLYD